MWGGCTAEYNKTEDDNLLQPCTYYGLFIFFYNNFLFTHNELIVLISVNGDWSEWSNFGECKGICGVGVMQRTRTCSNPAPSIDPLGKDCDGREWDVEKCRLPPCVKPGTLYNIASGAPFKAQALMNTIQQTSFQYNF